MCRATQPSSQQHGLLWRQVRPAYAGPPACTSPRPRPQEAPMPEAVIVSAARSPIGRAFKGSLTGLRPDDLTATIVRAALDKVPELDPTEIDDLYLGCG